MFASAGHAWANPLIVICQMRCFLLIGCIRGCDVLEGALDGVRKEGGARDNVLVGALQG